MLFRPPPLLNRSYVYSTVTSAILLQIAASRAFCRCQRSAMNIIRRPTISLLSDHHRNTSPCCLFAAFHLHLACITVMSGESRLLMVMASDQVALLSLPAGAPITKDLYITYHHACHGRLPRPMQTTVLLCLFSYKNKI